MKILDILKSRSKPEEVEPGPIDLTYMRRIPRGTPLATISMSRDENDAGHYARTAAEMIYHAASVADYDRLFDFFCDIAHLERWFRDAIPKAEPSRMWWYGHDGHTDLTDYDQRRIDDYYLITYYPDGNRIEIKLLKGLGDKGWQ